MSFFFSFLSLVAPRLEKEKKLKAIAKARERENYFFLLKRTVQQVQRVLRHGPAAVQRLRGKGTREGVFEPDVADEPSGGRVEDEAGGAGSVV